jgi:hypothetical protein
MELTPYVENLRRELTIAAEVGGDDTRALAERLLSPLDPAVRLTILEALAAATEEISLELAPGSVDVRLRGGAASFIVTPPPGTVPERAAEPAPSLADVRLPASADADDAAMVRINLRLPAGLKARIEDAAAGSGLSVNAWIVRAAAAGLDAEDWNHDRRTRRAAGNPGIVGDHHTGWAR